MSTTVQSRAVLDAQVDEESLRQNVVKFAALHRWRHYHTHDSRRSVEGFPDEVFIREISDSLAEMIVVEFKSQRGRCTAAQLEWLKAFSLVPNVDVYVWRPSDWSSGEIEKRLRRRVR